MKKGWSPGTSKRTPTHLFEAGNSRDVALLAEEAHADVVPELRRVGRLHRRHPVLDERYVHVGVVLDNGARGQDSLGVGGVMCQRVAQEVKRPEVLPHAQVQQADCGQELRVFRRKLECLEVDLDRALVVFFLRENEAQLHEGGVVALDRVGALERVLGRLELAQVRQAQPFVVPDLPVVLVSHSQGLLQAVKRRLVLAQQEQHSPHLLPPHPGSPAAPPPPRQSVTSGEGPGKTPCQGGGTGRPRHTRGERRRAAGEAEDANSGPSQARHEGRERREDDANGMRKAAKARAASRRV
jgi:hypothetical protein